MDYAVVRSAEHPLLPEAARLHYEALSYRSTITAFGEPFLRALYRALLDEGNGFLAVASDAGRLCGFILARVDSARMLSVVPRRWRRFAPLMLRTLLTRPSLWPRLVETLLYARKQGVDVAAELVIITVVDELRGAGIGRRVLGVLERELAARGIDRYKVTVHQAMTASNRFYAQNGMQLASTFQMYGVPWNVYVHRIARESNA